jgi:hypothetical protein
MRQREPVTADTVPAPGEPWLVARSRVRAAAARLLGDAALADELLPRHAGEPSSAPPLAATDLRGLAELYPTLLAPGLRKRTGAWFTPMSLAAPTAARTLAPWLAAPPRPLRIVDPAVGGGTFLLAAFDRLVAAGHTPAAAATCLHGFDLDATAAALAALAVGEASGADAAAHRRLATRIHGGDGLRLGCAGGFDAVLTNPPWETLQGDAAAGERVAALRPHFHHQGPGKLYTYRLFVERAHQLLADGGRFGLVVPASLWFDRDAEPLRRLLLDHCRWEWLFGFENRQRVFAIDGRYRFGIVVGSRGGSTTAVCTSFGHTDPADWQATAPAHVLYPRADLGAASPASGAFVEVEDPRDLDVLQRMAGHGEPLLGAMAPLLWRQGDFNLTSDRDRFVEREVAERDGYRHGHDGVWRRGPGDAELLPLYQGAMVHDLHPNGGGHAGGTGHATAWTTPPAPDRLRPVYLVPAAPWRAGAATRPPARLVLRTLSNATNTRTAIACLLPDVPCGNSLGVFAPRADDPTPLRTLAAGAAVLGSLAFDWALRLRLTGTNLNGFVLADCLLPRLADDVRRQLAVLALRLCAVLPWHEPLWRIAVAEGWLPGDVAFPRHGEAGGRDDLHTAIDVVVGHAFGLARADVAWLVRGCDLPSSQLQRGTPTGAQPRGFWRCDRSRAPELRRPNRWLRAI